ncbi:cytochrome c oxidase subunit I [Saccharata proteae CBS 121410]|uniref:Cytochrome c oxidase subunit I n=1 Tax=Saccharata proteae CBS 121410 TaxID=1314787 RepID=A0A9P4I1K3_9PEZI|nr:cytochrome c oxidase subunit I [Saccharata proteae CBS 121410]
MRINIPPLTRGLLVSLISLTLLNAALRPAYSSWVSGVLRPGDGAPFLAIIPRTAIYYPWVFLIATMVEQNIFELLITGPAIFYGGRYLERAWSSAEFAKFILFVSMIPNIASFLIYILGYAVSKNEETLTATISGGIAIQAGFLVAFKQLVPEHTVSIAKGVIRMRVKHFPAIFLIANTISGFLLGTETAMFLAWFGFLTSWTYLRFYRLNPSLSSATTGEDSYIRGDASDTFSFAHFFPEPLQTPMGVVGDQVYNALTAVRICTPFSSEDIDAGNEQALSRAEGGLPSIMNPARGGRGGGRREEAERRRALALKVLDQRLHAAASKPQPTTATAPSGPPLGNMSYEPERHDDQPASSEVRA